MSIVKIDYAPSKRPYALNLDSFATDEHGKVTIDAVWVTRREQVNRVSIGYLWTFRCPTVEAFMRDFDGRYGGHCQARWNGSDLWTEGSVTSEQHAALTAQLSAIHDALPEVPAGYDGWYSIKESNR